MELREAGIPNEKTAGLKFKLPIDSRWRTTPQKPLRRTTCCSGQNDAGGRSPNALPLAREAKPFSRGELP